MNSAADVRILLSLFIPDTVMTNALILFALAGIGAYLVRRVLRSSPATRGVDVGALSSGWIAEHRREEPR